MSRRAALLGLGLAAARPEAARAADSPVRPQPAAGDACILTPSSDEGPYYLDPHLVRSDVAEGRPGVPMRLMLRVIEAGSCLPLRGARLDIWHADAQGLYSGYRGQGDGRSVATTGQTFLRGTQFSNDQGDAAFDTVYPGWYDGRATHIHLKVFIEGRGVLGCQIFFPDALNEYIYTNVPAYGGRAVTRSTINANDPLVLHDDPNRLSFCAIREARDRYVASFVVGVSRLGRVTADGPPIGFIASQILLRPIGNLLGIGGGLDLSSPARRIAALIPGPR